VDLVWSLTQTLKFRLAKVQIVKLRRDPGPGSWDFFILLLKNISNYCLANHYWTRQVFTHAEYPPSVGARSWSYLNRRSNKDPNMMLIGAHASKAAVPHSSALSRGISSRASRAVHVVRAAPSPEIPEELQPYFSFLVANDKTTTDLPKPIQDLAAQANRLTEKAKPYTGFTEVAEMLNGRVAMMGFLGFVPALSHGGVLHQFSDEPFWTLVAISVIAVATYIPVAEKNVPLGTVKTIEQVPASVEAQIKELFTRDLELFHGRLAMLAIATLVSLEVFFSAF